MQLRNYRISSDHTVPQDFQPNQCEAAVALSACVPDITPAFANVPRPVLRMSGWRSMSIFAGCGGFDLGFGLEGVGTTYAYEKEESALLSFRHNHDGNATACDLSREIPFAEPVDVMLAGPPCQGFSTSGKRNPADPRNFLLGRVVEAARVNRPRAIIVENVPTAISGAHKAHWLTLESGLKTLGYNIQRIVLNACEAGVAQSRRRLFLIAWKGSPHVDLTFNANPPLSVTEALVGIDDDQASNNQTVRLRDMTIARSIKPGQKLSNVRFGDRNVHTWDIPRAFGKTNHREKNVLQAVGKLRRRDRKRTFGDGDPVSVKSICDELKGDYHEEIKRLISASYLKPKDSGIEMFHTYNGKYRRLEPSGLSPTVDTHFGSISNFIHPCRDRGLTLRESMRLQGFPDWFDLPFTSGAAFRLLGNAVPPPLAAKIARRVRDAILKA